jgi:cytochrome c-type biogenesis protein CcmH/NrfG
VSKGYCPLGSRIMPNDFPEARSVSATWSPELVYGLAAICLGLGVLVGYLVRGSSGSSVPAPAEAKHLETPAGMPQGHPTPTLEQMKQMADKKAVPLLEELKKHAKDKKVLAQTAYVYKSAHQFQDAANYFGKALEVDPKDVTLRTEMASCLYYSGDVDGALVQLQQSLKYEPKDANSLFNLGMIRWKGKNDPAGAVAAWQELLRTNPNLDRKPIVEQMIAEAQQGTAH